MLLWFVGASIVVVWNVFHDPRLDLRVMVAGVLAPDVIDGVTGGTALAHSVVTAVGLLVVVMLATIGRRPLRRRLLALPIGVFLHLVLDGAFADTRAFWWPLSGLSFPGDTLPSFDRGVGVTVALEVAGALGLAWAWRRFGWSDPSRRGRFLRTGTVEPC